MYAPIAFGTYNNHINKNNGSNNSSKKVWATIIECVYEPGVMLSALHALFNIQKNPRGDTIIILGL